MGFVVCALRRVCDGLDGVFNGFWRANSRLPTASTVFQLYLDLTKVLKPLQPLQLAAVCQEPSAQEAQTNRNRPKPARSGFEPDLGFSEFSDEPLRPWSRKPAHFCCLARAQAIGAFSRYMGAPALSLTEHFPGATGQEDPKLQTTTVGTLSEPSRCHKRPQDFSRVCAAEMKSLATAGSPPHSKLLNPKGRKACLASFLSPTRRFP